MVIAVEPVPEHFKLLCSVTKGLPVICLNAAVGSQVPLIPNFKGLDRSYGLVRASRLGLQTPEEYLKCEVYSLSELIEKYKPDIVKLNCEGCEHFVLNEIIKYANRVTFIIQFHDIIGKSKEESMSYLKRKIGDGKITEVARYRITVIFSP